MSRAVATLASIVLALSASTGFAYAAPPSDDLAPVAIGTFLVAVGVFLVLSIAFVIKSWLGLVKLPPPEDPHASSGHH